MISRIEAYNYRCFAKLAVDVGRYQVLAGANGAGKTTLLDIPRLLGDLLRAERVSDAFLQTPRRPTARATSFGEVAYGGRGTVGFSLEMRLPSDVEIALSPGSDRHQPLTHLRYELRLAVFDRGVDVAEEYLYLFPQEAAPSPGAPMQGREARGRRGPAATWRPVIQRPHGRMTEINDETTSRVPLSLSLNIESTQLALASVPADPSLFPAARWFIGLLRAHAVWYAPDWAALRRPAVPGDPPELLPDARNTPWLALGLQRADPARFALWIDHVRTALPQVANISVREREEDHHAYFVVEYAGGHRVTSSGLSDGTLQILALSLLPYLPASALPDLLVTEEPENGIHPQAIETVVQSLSSILDSQVWVSTHSPIMLAKTDLADVLVARLDDSGAADIIAGHQHPRLRNWQGALDLGSLFAAGVLS
jgi:predicted ATPase